MFVCDGFKSTNEMKLLFVRCELNASGCTWTFSTDVGSAETYSGQDMDELKRRFNGLLRTVMKDLCGQVPQP